MNHLSLFSGYEGFGLGLRLAGLPIKTVGYCEYDKYCQEIIMQRVRDGFLDDAPIWPDVRDFPGQLFNGVVDIITAGFPCQPHSVAGKRKGEADERNLWPDTLRIISEVGPGLVLLENVPGILANGYGGTVVGQLSEIGYDCKWGVVSAADVGANHKRARWWVLAYRQGAGITGWFRQSGNDGIASPRWQGEPIRSGTDDGGEVPDSDGNGCSGRGMPSEQERQHDTVGRGEQPGPDGKAGEVADAKNQGLSYAWGQSRGSQTCARPTDSGWWQVEPDVGRVADGTPKRVDRLKTLGNGIVPAVVDLFWRRLDLIGSAHLLRQP